MFVFRKVWRTLFSWNTRFEIRPFALLPTYCSLQRKRFKDYYYFTSKSIFSLFSFVESLPLIFWIMEENGLIKKLRLIPKYLASSTGKEIIPIHILFNITRSKDNQKMKFGQLVKYNVRKVFMQKSYK